MFYQLQKMSIFYSKLGREIKEKTSLKRSKYHEIGSKFGQKSSRGPFLDALWRPLGCPRGPRLNFGSERLVRWTPPGPPDGVLFSTFFQCKIHLIFYWISIACGNNPLRAWGRYVSEKWVEDKFRFIFVSWVHFAIIFVTMLHSVFIYF